MPQRLLHKAQMLKCSQRGSHSTLSLDFSQITQTSLRGEGRGLKGSRKSIFVGGTSTLQRREGEKLLYYPPKTSYLNLASRNWNIRFSNRNIWNLKYSHYRQNRTLRFVKMGCLIFPGSVRSVVYEAIVFHSSHLGF
jgi:hypothetical protein